MKKDHLFNSETAKQAQLLGAAKRKENTAKRRALKDFLADYLLKPAEKGKPETRIEKIVRLAIENLERNNGKDIELSDLLKIQEILGEKTTNNNVNVTAARTSEQVLREVFGDGDKNGD